jgi:hypothetical protein
MAIKNGADIVPVINFGTEDMVDVVQDLPMGWLPIPFLWGSDRTFPLLVPRKLEKIYFYFAPPIPTHQYEGDSENPEFLEEVRKGTFKCGIICPYFLRNAPKWTSYTPFLAFICLLFRRDLPGPNRSILFEFL